MDDFELFRARSLHGGVLDGEQSSPVKPYLGRGCLERHRGPTGRLASKSRAVTGAPSGCSDLDTSADDCNAGRSKFRARRDDVIAIPEVVRRSNAWVDFSASDLLAADAANRGQKSDRGRCRSPRVVTTTARSESSAVVGVTAVTFSDEAAAATTHEFDVYRLRSFATAAGRIVNRGDYFRVRQRVHPTVSADQLELLPRRGPFQTISEHPVTGAVTTFPSTPTPTSSTIEYRPIVYYTADNRDAADFEETAFDENENEEEEFSDERTRLLANRGRQTGYFGRIRRQSRSTADGGGFGRRMSNQDGDDAVERASRSVPDNHAAEQCRVTSTVRVVVLGDRGVGKTTLARQLLTSEHLANHSTSFNCAQGKSSPAVLR